MKTNKMTMVLVLMLAGAVLCVTTVASAGLVEKKYMVGDKDDFDDGDGDGVVNLGTGDVVSLPFETMVTPEAGNTDVTMNAKNKDIFDFAFNVDAAPGGSVLNSATVTVLTWDNDTNWYGSWGGQPIKVIGSEVILPDTLTEVAKRTVQLDVFTFTPAALALIPAGGGTVHVTIGTPETLGIGSSDVVIIDYAELKVEYETNGGGETIPIPEPAALVLVGLAGLVTRRRRG